MKRTVIVGASAAGLTAAETLRHRGWGGDLTLIGEELHPPYDRPPPSKQILTGAWEPERATLRPPAGPGAAGDRPAARTARHRPRRGGPPGAPGQPRDHRLRRTHHRHRRSPPAPS
ncbi:FAD-dependent oxidoreductase [Streptomyces pinistramenti]|uniref:FAD-dependent oxidoreductase n=1 Tax=Streptomyces pinistramenti TaxID=2884812 RepID=UPI0027E5A5C7|nr:FAD-dependent oxidoreductase [Streptomyces pinistramenti]